MVSSEGACAAYFDFGRKSLEKVGTPGMSDQHEQQIWKNVYRTIR